MTADLRNDKLYMEIIAFPYMAVSFLIGWAIFAPLSNVNRLDEWSFARLGLPELLAIFIPYSLVFGAMAWTVPKDTMNGFVIVCAVALASLIAIPSVLTGLYLLPKLNAISASKRVALVGVVIPIGFSLTIAWIVVPLYAFANSALYSIPATFAVAAVTILLRMMSLWIFRDQNSKPDHGSFRS